MVAAFRASFKATHIIFTGQFRTTAATIISAITAFMVALIRTSSRGIHPISNTGSVDAVSTATVAIASASFEAIVNAAGCSSICYVCINWRYYHAIILLIFVAATVLLSFARIAMYPTSVANFKSGYLAHRVFARGTIITAICIIVATFNSSNEATVALCATDPAIILITCRSTAFAGSCCAARFTEFQALFHKIHRACCVKKR
uniref:Uncharacterized protein n=1 Tax=Odontella aurita TaxID=265563 RepID=A0A7S4JU97_9STRA|mmetsp:Transcript_54430/g.162710  ORF Transcript_54430/g.162710 Transcript_54430/m.162710 type:complete len:204 (+) Transcript_54430:226-837(+)